MSIQKFSLQPLQTREFKNSSDHTNLNNTGSTNAHTQPNSPLPSSDQFLQSTPLLSDDQSKILSGESNTELEELSNKDPLAQEAALNVAYRKIAELEERIEQLVQEKECSCPSPCGENLPTGVSMEKYREMEKTIQTYTLLIESYSFENKNVSAKLTSFDSELGRARQENMMLKVQIENILNVLNISEENKEELWEDIEDKEVYISKIEKYTDDLKMSHIQILEQVKETLNASTTRNDELCASLQQRCEEIVKLQLDLTNLNETKEEVLRLTKNNEALTKELVETKKNFGQYKVENTQLKALITEKCNQVEELLQNFKKKEQILSATLQKMNLLDILFKQTTSENKELKTQIMNHQLNSSPSPYYYETSTSTRKSSKTPELAKTERKDPIRMIKENSKTKSLRGDESHRKMIQFLREKKKLSEGSNSLISQALKTIRSKSPKSHPVSEELSPVNNTSKARKNRCLTEWDDESFINLNRASFQIWPSTTKPMSPGHQYFPSNKRSTPAGKSYDVSHAVEALKEVEQRISLIVNHIKSILSGFENVKVTDIIARKVTVIDQWKDRLNNLEKLYKDIVKDRTRNGSRERNRREDNVSIKDLKESFVVFRDNGYIHLK